MPLIVEFMLLGVFALALFGLFRFLVSRLPDNRYYTYAMALAMGLAFLLFWLNGAVGIVGSENNDANMMYMFVLSGSFLASLMVRFRPARMVWVMNTAAAAFVLIAILALAFNVGVSGPVWPWDVVWITALFVGLLVFSGRLFGQAARLESLRREVT